MDVSYKHERFRDPAFPVYSSCQKGVGMLVVPHYHHAAELIYVSSGIVTIYIHGQAQLCQKGDIVFVPPYTVHSVTSNQSDAVIEGLVFAFSLIGANVSGIPVDKILSKSSVQTHIFSTEAPILPELAAGMKRATEAYHQNSPTAKLEILAALHQITALLVKSAFRSEIDYSNFDRLQPAIDYIEANYHQDIQLDELSALLNVCNDHMIRLFRSATGKTPIKYITELRLQEALRLLTATDQSVTECAGRAGFSSCGYMTRVFRAYLGFTPSQYRKKIKCAPVA